MATLNFTSRADGKYEATATANANYNLHIEFNEYANVSVFQKTAGNKYAGVDESNEFRQIYDYDFGGYVYPKSVKIVCDKAPSVAIITEG